jgi:putative ABC transport system substrate-binding protein
MLRMSRRDFITLLGGAAAVWPGVARGQRPAMPVVAVVRLANRAETHLEQAFRHGLTQTEKVAIEWRWAEGRYESAAEQFR